MSGTIEISTAQTLYELVNILLVGYGAGIPADPGRHELLRKPLSETVVEERF